MIEGWIPFLEDDRPAALRERPDLLLRAAAEVEVEVSRAEGAIVGISHYSVIESRAHAPGRRLSQNVQQRQMGETVVDYTEPEGYSHPRFTGRNIDHGTFAVQAPSSHVVS